MSSLQQHKIKALAQCVVTLWFHQSLHCENRLLQMLYWRRRNHFAFFANWFF